MTREPMEMLLKILLNGHRVTVDGNEYAMAEDGSLCVIMHGPNGEIPMKVDCDLAGFKKIADDIGKESLWLQCCSLSDWAI